MKEKLPLIKSFVTVSCVAILLVFSLFVNFGTFAWFSQSDKATANGLSVMVDYDNTIESIRYFRVTDTAINTDEAGTKHNIYKFGYNEKVLADQLVSVEGADGALVEVQERTDFSTPIGMNPYSELSGDCQVLVEITLSGDGDAFLSLDVALDTLFLGNVINQKRVDKTYDLDTEGLPLSSVLRFAVFTDLSTEDSSESYLVEEDAITVIEYNFIKMSKVDGETVYTFANPIPSSLSLTPTNRKIFIFFDYKSSWVEYINEQIEFYVDEAEHTAAASGGTFTDIVMGETNLLFIPDFRFHISMKE